MTLHPQVAVTVAFPAVAFYVWRDGAQIRSLDVGFRDDVWLDVQGSQLTGAGKMTERFRRPNYGTLQIDITIEDPAAYKQPFTVRVNQRLFADAELIEFICNENEKSIQHYDP